MILECSQQVLIMIARVKVPGQTNIRNINGRAGRQAAASCNLHARDLMSNTARLAEKPLSSPLLLENLEKKVGKIQKYAECDESLPIHYHAA